MLKSYKTLIVVGLSIAIVGITIQLITYFPMQEVAKTCPGFLGDCAPYRSWQDIKRAGAFTLVVGSIIFFYGLLQRNQKK